MTPLREWLIAHRACEDALDWVGERDAAAAWRECDRGNWLLWAADRAGADRRKLVVAAAACARLVVHLVPDGDERPLRAIEAAEDWIADPSAEAVAVTRSACAASAASAYSMRTRGGSVAAKYAAVSATAVAAAAWGDASEVWHHYSARRASDYACRAMESSGDDPACIAQAVRDAISFADLNLGGVS